MYHPPEDQATEACRLGRLVDHHLYSVTPLQELSIHTLNPLPEDEFSMRYIILIVDNFSKFVGVYLAKTTSSLNLVKAFYLGLEFLVLQRSSEAMEAPNSHQIWRKDSSICLNIRTIS